MLVGWLCWGLTSLSTIFQSCRDGAIASWVINQYFRGVKCLAQGHNTAEVGLKPRTSRSGVRHSTTEPPRSPCSEYKPMKGLGGTSPFHLFTNPRCDKSVWSWGSYLLYPTGQYQFAVIMPTFTSTGLQSRPHPNLLVSDVSC